MGRLNLICNGMMIFDDFDETTVKIVMPTIEGHVRKYFVGDRPYQNGTVDLQVGSYELVGPPPSDKKLIGLISPRQYLCILKGPVEVDFDKAAQTSAIVTVPKPKLVRLFRASEPSGSVFGDTPANVAHDTPATHHDVVVFSYFDLSSGTSIQLKDGNGNILASVGAIAGQTINWVLYSDEADPLTFGMLAHPTDGLNELLKIGGAGTHPTFQLSAIGRKDGAHSTAIGVTPLHMAAFHELPETDTGVPVQLHSGTMGCSGAAVGTSGN